VRTDVFRPVDGSAVGEAVLCVSALTPYKRVDVAVDACTRLGRRLDVIGAGPELARLRRRAGPTVRFLGWQPDTVVRDAVARCRAFLFPGEEEFGIAPLEAMAAGRPVIAYGRGALTETVVDGVTGLFFREQRAEALIDALERGEVTGWSPEKIRAHALRFSEETFRREMAAFVDAALAGTGREARAAC
jgi:glycosyltransferase involved in cell wall biosynthesis